MRVKKDMNGIKQKETKVSKKKSRNAPFLCFIRYLIHKIAMILNSNKEDLID